MKKQKKIQIRFIKNTKKRVMPIDEDSLRLYAEMMRGRWSGKAQWRGYFQSKVQGPWCACWFWNDKWVLEDALLASIRPPIILILINEVAGMIIRSDNATNTARQNDIVSAIRIGLVASLPLCVAAPLGVLMLIPTLAIFFILYWASTETPTISISH